jgi:hypothetical protein
MRGIEVIDGELRLVAVACRGDKTTCLPGAWDRACPVVGRVVMVPCDRFVRQFLVAKG